MRQVHASRFMKAAGMCSWRVELLRCGHSCHSGAMAARLVPESAPELAEELNGIQYSSSVTKSWFRSPVAVVPTGFRFLFRAVKAGECWPVLLSTTNFPIARQKVAALFAVSSAARAAARFQSADDQIGAVAG